MPSDPVQHERQEVPTMYRGLYRKAVGGNSRAASIKCMCLECQGCTDGARAAVRDCPSRACPLWAVRPYQVNDEEAEEVEVVDGQ